MAKRKGGERTGKAFKQLQLPDVATSVFRLLEEKKKIPTPPNHTTPLPLSDTKFQDPEKTPKCFFILLGKRVGDGVSVSSAAGVGSGHTGKISLRTRTPAVFSGVIREPSFQRVGGGEREQGASTQSVRKACRVCRPWLHWQRPCRRRCSCACSGIRDGAGGRSHAVPASRSLWRAGSRAGRAAPARGHS